MLAKPHVRITEIIFIIIKDQNDYYKNEYFITNQHSLFFTHEEHIAPYV